MLLNTDPRNTIHGLRTMCDRGRAPGPPRELGAEAEYHCDLAFLVDRQAVRACPGSAVTQQAAPRPISGSDQVSPAQGTTQQASGLAGPWGGCEGPPWRTAPPRPKSNGWSKTQAVHTPTGRLTMRKWTGETWVSDTTEDREAAG